MKDFLNMDVKLKLLLVSVRSTHFREFCAVSKCVVKELFIYPNYPASPSLDLLALGDLDLEGGMTLMSG